MQRSNCSSKRKVRALSQRVAHRKVQGLFGKHPLQPQPRRRLRARRPQEAKGQQQVGSWQVQTTSRRLLHRRRRRLARYRKQRLLSRKRPMQQRRHRKPYLRALRSSLMRSGACPYLYACPYLCASYHRPEACHKVLQTPSSLSRFGGLCGRLRVCAQSSLSRPGVACA